MKKIVTLIALALCIGAKAQQTDTLATFAVGDNEKITLKGSDAQGGVTLAVAGYNIAFSKPTATKEPQPKLNTRKQVFTMFGAIDVGFAALSPIDYSAYSTADAGFLDVNAGKSLYLGINLASLELGIDRRNLLVFKTGIDFKGYYYRLGNTTSITYSEGMIQPVTLDTEMKKSKFATGYFVLPVALEINPNKKLSFEAKAYAGILAESYTKYKKPKVKVKGIDGFNPYIGGVTLSATYNDIGIYCDYAITELFEKGKGPATNAISFGLAIHL